MKAFFENDKITYVEGTPEEIKRFLPNELCADLSTLPHILGENAVESLEKFLEHKDIDILLVESEY